MKYAEDWDSWSIEKQKAFQENRLKDFLNNQVIRFSPYYSQLHKEGKFQVERIKTLADLKNLPFTTKSDMLPSKENPRKPQDFVLQPKKETVSSQLTTGRKLQLVAGKIFERKSFEDQILREYLPIFYTATTGRSAGQVPFVYTYYDVLRLKVAGKRLYTVAGMRSGKDNLINLFPYAPHLAFWVVYHGGEESGVPSFHTGGGKILGTERILDLIDRLRPTTLVGVPGYMYHLLRLLSERKKDLSFVKTLALGAERTTTGHRAKFQDFLSECGAGKVAILSTYGCTEARMAWIECPEGDQMGYHLYPDLGLFEIINPETGELVKDGESGEIVFTSIDSRGSVVVRFRTGDIANGGIVRAKCPACGRTVPRLSSNITRLSNNKELNLTKIKGTLVDLNNIDEVVHSFFEIVEWQLEIGKVNNDPLDNDSVNLYISLRPNTHEEKLLDRLGQEFQNRIEFKPNRIIVESTEVLLSRLGMETELKEKRIIDVRKSFSR